MIGLPAHAGIGRPEEWMDRVHADDIAPLKEALEAHLSGQTDHFQHEHRIRHEDGTYRRFLLRRGAPPAPRGGSPPIPRTLTPNTGPAGRQEAPPQPRLLPPPARGLQPPGLVGGGARP